MAQYDPDHESYLKRKKEFILKIMKAFSLTEEQSEIITELFYEKFIR